MVLAADIHDLSQKRMAMMAEQDALQAKLMLQEQKRLSLKIRCQTLKLNLMT